MKRYLMFCSNPVNGGTARMFYELWNVWPRLPETDGVLLYPCVNEANPVEIYKQMPGIIRLPIRSEVEVCGEYPMYSPAPIRMLKKTSRRHVYSSVKSHNINVMKHFLKDGGYDGVLIHNGGYVGDDLCNQMLAASYEAKIPDRIMVFHNDFYRTGIRKLAYRGYDKMIDKCATKIITVSNYTKNRILQSSFLTKDMSVIYNGITVGTTLSREEKLAFLSDEKAIGLGIAESDSIMSDNVLSMLMIGNFSYVKGHMTMLKALSELKKDSIMPAWHVTIIGNIYEEPCYKECVDYINEHGLSDNITIHHGIHNASEYTDLFDLALVPSMADESFGIISVEAMAKGTPVVATDCGGIPEVVTNDRDGIVVPVGDHASFANAIKKLALNPELRKDFGANCKTDYNEKFTPGPMALQYLRIL